MSAQYTTDLFAGFPIVTKCRVCVVIPVRDEAENIRETLASFARQVDLRGTAFDSGKFEILVLANNCADDSAAIIKKFQRENPSLNLHLAEINLPSENANVGFVRRALMNAACSRLEQNEFGGGVIMTTDGDTIVADDWIAANLHEIERGADAVGGRIIITNGELEKMDALCRETHLQDEEYRLLTAEIESLADDLPFDSAPRHHQHFNASFAVTTAIYQKAGGVPDVKFLEDLAFFERLQRLDARVRHSLNVVVYTSSRHVGRSEVGLSFQLNLWRNLKETGADYLVESAETIIERFRAKRILREIRRDYAERRFINVKKINSVAERFYISPEIIVREIEEQRTFGELYENLMREQNAAGEWQKRNPPIPLAAALTEMRRAIVPLRRRAKSAVL